MIKPPNSHKPPLESAKRLIEVDMSPSAIQDRLRTFFELWNSWQALKKYQPRNMLDEDAPYPILVPRRTE